MSSTGPSVAIPTSARAQPRMALPRQLGIGVAVFLVYVAAAKAGFQFAFVAEQVTTVWAPSGIAIATVLLFGRRFWPAIWLGAFLVNAGTAAPVWTAFLLATGNTLEAVVAGFALRRLASFDAGLRRLSDVFAFVAFA